MSTEVVMPQMGESIAEGTITRWLKKGGEHVNRDEPLFEISTEKVDAEIPSPAAGTLTEIRFKEGDTVEINTTVAVLDGGAGGEAPAAAPAEAAAPAAAPAPKAEVPAQPVPAAAPTPPRAAPAQPVAQQAKAPEPASSAPAEPAAKPTRDSGNGSSASSAGATAEDLRRTKSSPLVRKIA